jgi:hypothetical protein
MAKNKSLEGQWAPLMRAGVYGDHSYSSSDLDEVVSNFDPNPAGKIPIHFGKSDQGGPILGKVTALQRDGNTLSGQVSEVDPRLDQLFISGKLGGRRSFTVKRTPKGLALDRVGFHAPREFVNGTWRDGPATEADLTSLTQGGASGHSGTATFASDAHAVISFEEILLPLTKGRGRSMQGSDSEWRFQSNSEALSDLAKQRQREGKISFGKALSQVAEEHPKLTLPGTTISFDDDGPALTGRCRVSQNSVELNRLATQYQHVQKVSFAEALSAVAADNPELTR